LSSLRLVCRYFKPYMQERRYLKPYQHTSPYVTISQHTPSCCCSARGYMQERGDTEVSAAPLLHISSTKKGTHTHALKLVLLNLYIYIHTSIYICKYTLYSRGRPARFEQPPQPFASASGEGYESCEAR
jgi:hypothetical protein